MRPTRAAAVVIGGLALLMLTRPVAAATAPAPGDGTTGLTATGGVVVNEFAPSEPVWQVEEFVELRNTGDQWANLDGWELVACLSPTTWQVAAGFGPDDEIPPGGFMLLAHPDYAGFGSSPDHFYHVEVPVDGGWLLYDPWNGYEDGVGLTSGLDCTESDPAPQCDWAAGEAVTRNEQGTDTDDNAADLTCQLRTPGS